MDTEYTSWEGSFERDWSDPGEFKEIVQFAAFSYSKNNESKLFDFYIKPKLNPELSSYFKKLTGISQEVVNNSRSNLRTIVDFLSKLQHSHTIVSWGPDLHSAPRWRGGKAQLCLHCLRGQFQALPENIRRRRS